MLLQPLPKGGADLVHRLGGHVPVLPNIVPHQLLQVAQPLPQGRDVDDDRGQAVKQVLAQLPRLAEGIGVLVAGGDDTHVDGDIARAADALDQPLLKGPQQLGLHPQAHGVQLVQKQGAVVGLLHQAHLVRAAGKGPLHRAEQHPLDQGLREGGAVHRHKFLPPPGAQVMDALGKYLFARARLPLDEDVVVPGGHLPGQLLGLHQSGGGADEVGQGIPGVGAGALHLRLVL